MATQAIPSFSQAAEAAGLPKRIKMDDLAALGTVTWISAHGDTARLPGTNEETDGFTVVVEATDGRQYEAFVGAKVLVNTLARMEFPFRAKIVKSGQAWSFAD